MLDGLGLAETTPGPLIMVTQFVGFMGAFREAGGLPPLVAGDAEFDEFFDKLSAGAASYDAAG